MENQNQNNYVEQKICEFCHEPLLPTYYFCPNCGTKVNSHQLSTGFFAQLGLYLFSIILPLILYMVISKWKGIKYIQSKDPKTRIVGIIALILLITSSVITFWYSYNTALNLGKSISDQLNADLGNLQL